MKAKGTSDSGKAAHVDEIRQGKLPCPMCGQAMRIERKQRIEVDVCPDHGVWLDKGELEEIARAVRDRTQTFQRSLRRVAVAKAKRDGRFVAAQFGFWSLLFHS